MGHTTALLFRSDPRRVDPRYGIALLTVFTLLLFVEPAGAQVRRVYDGNALDANAQYGSGSRNSRVQRSIPNYANLYVTGNVTRGQQFRGFSPIKDPSQLSVGLPSSGLSSFRADGVSIGDLRAGRSARMTQPFFLPETTVTNRGALRAGLNRPGSSMPRSPFVVPRGGTSNQQLLELDAQRLTDRRPRGDALTSPILTHSALPGATSGIAPFAPRPSTRESRFGLREPTYTTQGLRSFPPVASELPARAAGPSTVDAYRPAREPPAGLGTPANRDDQATDREPDDRSGVSDNRYRVDGSALGRLFENSGKLGSPIAPRIGTRLDGTIGENTPSGVQPTPEPSNVPTGHASRPNPRGVLDPTGSTGLIRMPQERESDAVSAGTRPPVLAPLVPQRTALTYDQVGKIRSLLDAEAIDTFVGSGDPLADPYFRKAETHLRNAEYYRASGQFGIARQLEPGNPLASMGRAHALVGTGDMHSAELEIERAITIFPGIAQFRIDLPKLLPVDNVLGRRRAELGDRLRLNRPDQDRYRLQFLLGYLEWFSGMPDAGLINLAAAANASPPDSPVRQFYIGARDFIDEPQTTVPNKAPTGVKDESNR